MIFEIILISVLVIKFVKISDQWLMDKLKKEKIVQDFPTPPRMPVFGNYYFYPSDPRGELTCAGDKTAYGSNRSNYIILLGSSESLKS